MRGAPEGTAAANSWPPPSSGSEPGRYGGPPAGDPGTPGPYDSGSQQGGPYPGGQYPGGPYPGGPYPGSPYPGPPRGGNGFAVASLVLGVIGLVLALVVVGALPGLLAIGLGIAGLVRARRGSPHKGLAIAGITLGVISLILAVVITVLVGRFLGDRLTAYRDCLRLAQTTDQRRACEDQLRRGLQNDTQGITALGARPIPGAVVGTVPVPGVAVSFVPQPPPGPAARR